MGEVYDFLSDAIDTIEDILSDIMDEITDAISGILDDVSDWVGETADDAMRFIIMEFKRLYNILGYMGSKLGYAISAPLVGVAHIMETIMKWVVSHAWAWVKEAAGKFDWLENWVKDKIGWIEDRLEDLYNYVGKPIENFVKEAVDKAKEIFEPEIKWIKDQLKDLYDYYYNDISPVLTEIMDKLHKIAVLTDVVKDIEEGRLKEAFLEGVSLADQKLAETLRNMFKDFDNTVKGIMEILGFSQGYISSILTDVRNKAENMIRDIERIIENTGLDFLEDVVAILEFVSDDIAKRLRDMLNSNNNLLRSILAMLTDPVVEASRIIQETLRDYRKYEKLVRIAELRKQNALKRRPHIPIIFIHRMPE